MGEVKNPGQLYWLKLMFQKSTFMWMHLKGIKGMQRSLNKSVFSKWKMSLILSMSYHVPNRHVPMHLLVPFIPLGAACCSYVPFCLWADAQKKFLQSRVCCHFFSFPSEGLSFLRHPGNDKGGYHPSIFMGLRHMFLTLFSFCSSYGADRSFPVMSGCPYHSVG